jgi:hypothetical protein
MNRSSIFTYKIIVIADNSDPVGIRFRRIIRVANFLLSGKKKIFDIFFKIIVPKIMIYLFLY